ncbi:ral guanine nucleotide dissociation stimulator-like [Dasypus novemcinctus]|uniref:ral guanine nucleotide dissociation stimulator-like n=1 Tax=Dasypus novemcinctus TaxID=9361 RepID=UPI0039C95E98
MFTHLYQHHLSEGKACLAAPPEPLPELKSAGGQATPSEPSCPWTETSENLLREEKANFLVFPPELVAEQLTQVDAKLFKKVVPYHCLGAIWSQCNKKGQEHVVLTVCAIITQFNCVTNCVIITCLGNQSMKAQVRARVVKHWIEVARECQILKDFSFYAILSALESQSVHYKKKTWEKVSRGSLHLFQMLSEIVSNENNYSQSCELIIKEEISKFATLEMKPERFQKEQQQEMGVIEGIVPCLGTFLTQFLMVDNAMQEHLEEYQMIAEFQQLQVGCSYDSLMPSEHFGTWFGDVEQLSKNDSGDAAESPHTHEADSSSSKVKIHLDHVQESHDGNEMKVTNQEMAPAVILKAMEEHNLDEDKPEDYKLVQIISKVKVSQGMNRQPDLWGWSSRRKLYPPCPTANPSPASAQYTVCLPKSICKGVLSQQSLTSQPSIREFLSTAKPPEKGKKKQKPWPPWLRSRRSACYRVSAHPRRELPTPSWDLRLYVIDVSSLLPSHRIDVQTPSNQQKSPKQRGPKEPSTLPNRPLLRHYQRKKTSTKFFVMVSMNLVAETQLVAKWLGILIPVATVEDRGSVKKGQEVETSINY